MQREEIQQEAGSSARRLHILARALDLTWLTFGGEHWESDRNVFLARAEAELGALDEITLPPWMDPIPRASRAGDGWESVEDAKRARGQVVDLWCCWIYGPHTRVPNAEYREDSNGRYWWSPSTAHIDDSFVTHWRPLPAPPEAGKEG